MKVFKKASWLFGAVLGVLLASGPATHAGPDEFTPPSFDCLYIETGVNGFTCADKVLATLDAAVNQSYESLRAGANPVRALQLFHDQTAWLSRRAAACDVQDGQGPYDDPMANLKIVGCLIEHYRDRVFALDGVPPTFTHPQQRADVFHPACFDALFPSFLSMDLALCRRLTKRLPYDYDEEHQSYAYRNIDRAHPSGGMPTYSGYEIIGEFADETALVLVTVNGGGTGYFTFLAIVEGLPGLTPDGDGQVRLTNVRRFGDRCHGGLRDAAVTGPYTYRYSKKLTSFTLMTQDDQRDWRSEQRIALFTGQPHDSVKSEGRLALIPGEDLDNSAISCVGIVSVEHNMVTGQDTIIGYTVDRLPDLNWSGRYRLQRCFNDTMISHHDTLKSHDDNESPLLSVDELKELTALFETNCVSRGLGGIVMGDVLEPLVGRHFSQDVAQEDAATEGGGEGVRVCSPKLGDHATLAGFLAALRCN